MTAPPPTLNEDMCENQYSCDFKDFIECCLVKNPQQRISAAQALRHPFFRKACPPSIIVDYLNNGDYEKRRRRYYPSTMSTPSSEEDIYDTWEFPPAIDTSVPRLCITEPANADSNFVESPSESPVTPADDLQRPAYSSNVQIKLRVDQFIDQYPSLLNGKRV